MNWNRIEGNLKQLKSAVKEKLGTLSSDTPEKRLSDWQKLQREKIRKLSK